MFSALRFAVRYALRNLWRDRRRTAFALFSVAAGVATVVALRWLGLMLTDALTTNTQAFLRADFRASTRNTGFRFAAYNDSREAPIDEVLMTRISTWASKNNIEVQFIRSSELMQIAVIHNQVAGMPAFLTVSFIDSERYPFYDVIRAETPTRTILSDLMRAGPDSTVLGKRLATQLGATVGDQVRIGPSKTLYTVRGIVPDTAESILNDPAALIFSFAYLDKSELPNFDIPPNTATRAYFKIPADMNLRTATDSFLANFPRAATTQPWALDTSAEVLRTNQTFADALSRFVLLLSLIGLVIGGVGIINTMWVAVNRRSAEIAVLKTLGLKGRSVSLIFLIESALYGLLGSLLGGVLGMLLSLVARNVGEQAVGVALPWRFYFEPILIGGVLGIGITICFCLLPTLMAGRVRPLNVLRQGSIPLARAGCLPSIISLTVLTLGLGAVVDAIIGNNSFPIVPIIRKAVPIPLGILGTFVVLLLIGLVLGVMWLLVWVLGHIPTLRLPDLRIAIRGLSMHRDRTAFSLMALIIGMTALSGTLIMTRSLNILLYTSLSEPLGGNVIAIPLLPVMDQVNQTLTNNPDVAGYRVVRFVPNARLVAINSNRSFRNTLVNSQDWQTQILARQLDLLIGVRVVGSPARGKLMAGRFLGPDDEAQSRIVIPYAPELDTFGVKVGSKLTYRIGSPAREQTFEVVGIVMPDARAGFIPFSLSDSAMQVPLTSVPGAVPFDVVIADVKTEGVAKTLGALGNIPGAFVFDITIFDSLLSRFLNQFAALPLLVAGLSLFAAGALIASTVSLATMERRRQIGIFKVIGMKRRQVLRQLLLENGVVGFSGGLMSLLPTLFIIALAPELSFGLVHLPVPYDLIGLMLLLSVTITLFATLLTAWSASSEKPLTVLRYE